MPKQTTNIRRFGTDRAAVAYILRLYGPCSDHAIRHHAKAIGHPMTESSARTRRHELGAVPAGTEKSSSGVRATLWAIAR